MNDFNESELDLITRQRKAMADLHEKVHAGDQVYVGEPAKLVIDEFNRALLALQEASSGVPSINDYITLHNAALDASAQVVMMMGEGQHIAL